MVGWILIVTCASLACLATGFPTQPERRYKRSPLDARSMMVRGYFRGQPIAGYKFDPETMMTAYSLGNMATAGSFQKASLKPGCQGCDQQESDMRYPSNGWQTPQAKPEEEETPKWTSNEKPQIETPADEKDDRRPKTEKKPKRRPTEEEAEEEDYEDQGAATFSRFFPMTFNFPGTYGRSGEEQGQNPGLATAISNSFSQGKGAIASSQATAYGSPDSSQIRKSLQSRRRY